MPQALVGLDGLEQLEAVQVGHVDVGDDEVKRSVEPKLAESHRTVLSLFDSAHPHLPEKSANDATHRGVVLNDKDSETIGNKGEFHEYLLRQRKSCVLLVKNLCPLADKLPYHAHPPPSNQNPRETSGQITH